MQSDLAQALLEKYGKKNPPQLKAGDTIRVHQKIKEGEKERIQVFEGLVIAVKHGATLDGTYTVRKIAAGGIGVERTYPLHSPNVLKVEKIKSAEVNRAKLYYMRDRLGKAARFKNETRQSVSWSEPDLEEVIEELEEAAEEIRAEEEVPAETAVGEETATQESAEENAAQESEPEKVEEEKGKPKEEVDQKEKVEQSENDDDENKENVS
jgi:large subunit ribosomal protein L19